MCRYLAMTFVTALLTLVAFALLVIPRHPASARWALVMLHAYDVADLSKALCEGEQLATAPTTD